MRRIGLFEHNGGGLRKATRRARGIVGAVLAGGLASQSALAQSATAAGLAEMGADATEGRQIVVVASRSGGALHRDQLGSSVSIVDSRALTDRQTRIVSDALRDIPGVAVSRLGAVGGLTQVRIRGTEGNQILTIIDGIKASDPYQGEFDYGTLIADDAARIEVLRGQQSSLYGSDAIGGVINYTTLSGREAPGIRLRAEGGSFGTYQGAARVAGAASDFDYALSASGQHTDGYPVAPGGTRDIGAKLAGFSGKANWTPSSAFKLTLVGRHNYTHADSNNQGLPSNPPIVQGRQVQTARDTPGSFSVNNATYGLVRGELNMFGDLMTTALSGQATDTTRNGYGAAGRTSGDKGERQRYSLENTLRLGDGDVKHRLTTAIDAERQRFRNTSPGAFVNRDAHLFHTYGLTGQYTLTVGDGLGVGASVRHDWNDYFKDNTTWHVDASYLLASGTRFHGAAGSAVNNPGPFELFGYSDGKYIGNPTLKPERSKGWEAGVDQKLAGGAVRFGATYFNSRLVDEIYTVFPAPLFIASSLNRTTKTHQEGVEAFVEARLGDWRADANYTYLHAPQSRSVFATPTATTATLVETQAVRRPKNIGSVNVSYAPDGGPFSATLTVRYNGKQKDVAFTSSFAAVYANLDSFTLVNLAATYNLTKTIQIFGRVENLFDENYQEVFGYATPGRAAYGGVRLRF